MKIIPCRLCNCLLVGLLVLLVGSATALAQESQSAPLAKELAQLLDQAKLDSVAAKDPSAPDQYTAALYFPGSQLLVISAKYSVPVLFDERLAKKDYKEAYIELNSASVPETKTFIMDAGADGLRAKRVENQGFDTFDSGGKAMTFDGEWRKQKITEDDYNKAFAEADAKYAGMLKALIAELNKK
jgi:hypothetical protein